jgi:hypothetical protein
VYLKLLSDLSAVGPHNLVQDGRLIEGPLRWGRGIEDHWFSSESFVADVQYNRPVGMWLARVRAITVGRAKFLNAGGFRLGDALERYGESRRRGHRPMVATP